MRTCAKMRCGNDPQATVALAYTDRTVLVTDLVPERDPNLLDLCDEHVQRMTPPVGWLVRDERTHAPAIRPSRSPPRARASGTPGGGSGDPRQRREMTGRCYGHPTPSAPDWTHDA
jgi:hypothetical protein